MVLRFPRSIKLTATIVESGIKHHNPHIFCFWPIWTTLGRNIHWMGLLQNYACEVSRLVRNIPLEWSKIQHDHLGLWFAETFFKNFFPKLLLAKKCFPRGSEEVSFWSESKYKMATLAFYCCKHFYLFFHKKCMLSPDILEMFL